MKGSFVSVIWGLLVAVITSSSQAHASDLSSPRSMIKIEIGDTNDGSSRDEIRRLKRRIRTLEEAVIELQNELMLLRREGREVREIPSTKVKSVACMITDPFGTTALGRATTELEAKAKVAEVCEQKNIASFSCKAEDMKCEREN